MLLAVASVVAPAAEDPEQLDAEFLEYLANLEGDDDDWTLVAKAEEAKAESTENGDRKAEKAPKPAVDER